VECREQSTSNSFLRTASLRGSPAACLSLWTRLGPVAAVAAVLTAACWLGSRRPGAGTAIALATIVVTAAVTLGAVSVSRIRDLEDITSQDAGDEGIGRVIRCNYE
jgi:hypothetical protein